MAQTSEYTTMRNVKVELSLNGSTWINISGQTSSVQVSGGRRTSATYEPQLGQKPVVTLGIPEPTELLIKTVWGELNTSASEILHLAYQGNYPVYVRYSPKGGSSGQKRFVTGQAYITNPPLPEGNVEDGSPILVELRLRTDIVTPEVIP